MPIPRIVDFTNIRARVYETNGSGVFPARYDGTCGNCGQPFNVGDLVRYDDTCLVAIDCCTEPAPDKDPKARVMPRGRTVADRCPRCFIIHATGQTDCE